MGLVSAVLMLLGTLLFLIILTTEWFCKLFIFVVVFRSSFSIALIIWFTAVMIIGFISYFKITVSTLTMILLISGSRSSLFLISIIISLQISLWIIIVLSLFIPSSCWRLMVIILSLISMWSIWPRLIALLLLILIILPSTTIVIFVFATTITIMSFITWLIIFPSILIFWLLISLRWRDFFSYLSFWAIVVLIFIGLVSFVLVVVVVSSAFLSLDIVFVIIWWTMWLVIRFRVFQSITMWWCLMVWMFSTLTLLRLLTSVWVVFRLKVVMVRWHALQMFIYIYKFGSIIHNIFINLYFKQLMF